MILPTRKHLELYKESVNQNLIKRDTDIENSIKHNWHFGEKHN